MGNTLKTPLFETHLANGARMAPFGGFTMPIQYTGIFKEHEATRTGATLFDTCHMGEFHLSGITVLEDLEMLLSCHVTDMQLGQCRYGLLCNDKGGVKDDLLVYRLGERAFMLVVNAGTQTDDFEWIQSHLSATTVIENQSETTAKIDLQGPGSPAIMNALIPGGIMDLKFYRFAPATYQGEEVLVPMTALVDLEEPEKFSDWETRFDLNTSVNRGNTDSQNVKLSAYTMYKYDRQRHILDILLNTEEQNGIQTKDRDFAQYNFNLEVSEPWFFGTSASYERDPFKNQKFRYNIVPAMGYDIFNDAARLFSLQLGAGYQAEESVDQNTVDSVNDGGAVASFILRFSWEFGSPDLEVYVNNNTTQSFYGRKNLSTQWVTGARYEITDLLYLNMEFDYSRESKPLEGAEPEDLALLFGFGMEFE